MSTLNRDLGRPGLSPILRSSILQQNLALLCLSKGQLDFLTRVLLHSRVWNPLAGSDYFYVATLESNLMVRAGDGFPALVESFEVFFELSDLPCFLLYLNEGIGRIEIFALRRNRSSRGTLVPHEERFLVFFCSSSF